MLARQQLRRGEALGVQPLGRGVEERRSAARRQLLEQLPELSGLLLEPAAAQCGQRGGPGLREATQYGAGAGAGERLDGAFGGKQPADHPLGIQCDQRAQLMLQMEGEPGRAVLLQQLEHPLGVALHGDGQCVGVLIPPLRAQLRCTVLELVRGVVQQHGRVAAGERRQVARGMGQFRQQPGGELRRAGRQQSGRL
ncbi:hypothetical protein ASC99_18705 [Kitasatospora sp. Root107]|nr:hypothetical protein ASC99_18705 [Kitasatospora sp. Root107]